MRVQLRETGSILVQARREDVLDVLQSAVKNAELVAPDRLEARGSTYVVRQGANGVQIIHARSESTPVALATREREELRREVESDLFRLQRLFDVR